MFRSIKMVLVLFIMCGLSASTKQVYPVIEQQSFSPGEILQYRVSFGFIGIGDATMVIDDQISHIKGRPVYKVDVYGKTTGMVDWVARVDDHWGALVDTAALLPHKSYRNISEGNYKKNEITRFDHQAGLIRTQTMDQKTGMFKAPMEFQSNMDQVRDILSGYLYLRSVDFSKLEYGDEIRINGFLEDTFYPMRLIYDGHEKIRTKAGKFRAIRLIPLMPEDGVFDGKRSVTVWISDDENKIPLRVEAKMFVGNTTLEISGFDRVKNPLSRL